MGEVQGTTFIPARLGLYVFAFFMKFVNMFQMFQILLFFLNQFISRTSELAITAAWPNCPSVGHSAVEACATTGRSSQEGEYRANGVPVLDRGCATSARGPEKPKRIS